MAQGFATLTQACEAAQRRANKSGTPVTIYRTAGRVYKFSVSATHSAGGRLMIIHPKEVSNVPVQK